MLVLEVRRGSAEASPKPARRTSPSKESNDECVTEEESTASELDAGGLSAANSIASVLMEVAPR